MTIAVSEFIVRYLELLGVEVIFGIPGAHILPVYDSLHGSRVRPILAKHEQGAAFMAGGYARVSGKIGACITTAGPGATNLVTGVANAYADRQPLLVITGEAPTHIFGKGGLQESSGEGGTINQSVLFNGITRYHRLVERTDYLPQVLNQASRILLSDRPGPVLLSFPFDLQREQIDAALLAQTQVQPQGSASSTSPAALEQLLGLVDQAKNPVILAGYGVIRAQAQAPLQHLSHTLTIPVATSLKGKGAIDERRALALGSLGVTSSGLAYQYIVEQADLLLVLGAGFNERTSYLWDSALTQGKQVIQLDSDPDQLEKVLRADLAIQGDIATLLEQLLARLKDRPHPPHQQRLDTLAAIKAQANGGYAMFQSGFSLVEHFFARMEEHFPSGATIFDDNLIFAQNFYPISSGNHYHPNSGISSLGHAIPAAIGGRFAAPSATFAILGDGGFQMCCMEIMTAVNYQIPLNILLFNNATMGLIRKNQHQQYAGRYISCDFVNPDFALLARSFGIHYVRLDTKKDVDGLFAETDLHQGINLIEIPLHKDLFPNYSSKR